MSAQKLISRGDETENGVKNARLTMAVWVQYILSGVLDKKKKKKRAKLAIRKDLHCNSPPQIHFTWFLSRLTHLFRAHTLPGLHHHLDTLQMPLKYHLSFEATKKEKVVPFQKRGTGNRITALGWCFITLRLIKNSNYPQMQVKAAEIKQHYRFQGGHFIFSLFHLQ